MDFSMFNLDFTKSNILVLGDVMLDIYYQGKVSRISPEAPVPIVKVTKKKYALGGAANVSSNLAHLQAKASLVGNVGDDDNKQILLGLLQEKAINNYLIDIESPTITKMRIIGEHQQIVRLDFEEIVDFEDSNNLDIKSYIKIIIKDLNAVIISDYAKGVCNKSITKYLIDSASKYSIPIIVDPKGNDWEKYRGSTIITPNFKEFAGIVGQELVNSDRDIELYAPDILTKYEITYLLITRSEQGMSLVSKNGIKHFHTEAKDVYDVSGAGDTVVAVLAAALSSGYSIYDATILANKAAGIAVSKFGTTPVNIEELRHYIYPNRLNHILSKNLVIERLRDHQLKGDKVVFTNGCFDILHYGHASYLEGAKNLGDILVVAINSDNSVRKLKGNNRPINSEINRAELIAALKYVDYVTIFEDDTPYELIKAIRPDILIKGGDYTPESVVGKEWAKEVVILPFIDGMSTTNTLYKLNNGGQCN